MIRYYPKSELETYGFDAIIDDNFIDPVQDLTLCTRLPPPDPSLASIQHARQRRLLRTCDSKAVHALDLDPHFRIGAVVAC